MSNEDIKNLDLLSLFHYVVAGIVAFFACIPFMHVFMGLAMVSGKFFEGGKGTPPPPFVGWMFIVMGCLFILLGWTMAVFIYLAGRRLKSRRSRLFCMVIAGIECMFMPFGTVLGIFTIITLNKDSVKELFDGVSEGEP
ncbi:hypothetical protein ACFL2T_02655 [Elusimicrobiota bacterium]